MIDLDAQLMAAHADGDKTALAVLYERAAAEAAHDNARAFYLTQAYVFALETNAPQAPALRALLVQMGRDTPA
ncbi:hypothetical protein So717_20480 [Roseobacter cerasinus]|uniref:Uncharacterized protein n=1 Tax=Roseobacter cerasinus TaxID=2602289 RepID=A0A640VTS4_9RHOB|nr:hypothetical protein [Roseobacter cerasinus]GFE50295.1 hypothetical protein So717_20480 [Roseobacter cerasinus]